MDLTVKLLHVMWCQLGVQSVIVDVQECPQGDGKTGGRIHSRRREALSELQSEAQPVSP